MVRGTGTSDFLLLSTPPPGDATDCGDPTDDTDDTLVCCELNTGDNANGSVAGDVLIKPDAETVTGGWNEEALLVHVLGVGGGSWAALGGNSAKITQKPLEKRKSAVN